jgi:hypothetical protein
MSRPQYTWPQHELSALAGTHSSERKADMYGVPASLRPLAVDVAHSTFSGSFQVRTLSLYTQLSGAASVAASWRGRKASHATLTAQSYLTDATDVTVSLLVLPL